MSTESERRAEGARISFDALVEVGGSLGPSFEAQAINISEMGMHLRTAYLPEIGQPLTCRFDAGPNASVMAAGEVIWKQEAGRGGEFGIRFTNLDPESVELLQQICAIAIEAPTSPAQAPGSRIRLHIEGLGQPMRARVREASPAEVSAYSELGFLQMGKPLQLEDVDSGERRPARIERVECEVDPETRVPQLIFTLEYDDAIAREYGSIAKERLMDPMDSKSARASADEGYDVEVPVPTRRGIGLDANEPVNRGSSPNMSSAKDADDLESIEAASGRMKGAIARSASKVTPALTKMFERAKTTIAILAAKRNSDKDDMAIPLRRTTSPAPGGGLHASGRKVVRGGEERELAADIPMGKFKMNKKVAAGGAIGIAVILAAIAMHKPAAPPPLASAPPADSAAAPATPPVTPAPAPVNPPPSTDQLASNNSPMNAMPMPDPQETSTDLKHHRKSRVAPFGNGPVSHANLLHLKMDGAIEKIEGAAQPTGFTVVLPNRRSLEAAGPLASRDSRIASIRVTNESNGAELAVTFKDGVPNYQVRAKNDTLEIALAPVGQVEDATSAKDPAKHDGVASKKKHRRHKHPAAAQ
jgi:hypothetical protein